MNRRSLTASLAVGLLAALSYAPPTYAADPPANCLNWNPFLAYCIEWGTGGNGTKPPASGSGGGNTAPLVCYWVNIPPITDPTIYADFELNLPPDGVTIQWQSWECSDGSPQFNFRWVFDYPPEVMAWDIRTRLSGELAEPTIVASPPIGTPSIIGVPVFVAVANWSGVVTDTGCAGGICVTVTANPKLSFAPGEATASTIACDGSGTTFNRSIPPAQQASNKGACVHTYRQRTSVQGRPKEWPGAVAVTWTITWTANTGVSGVLPAVTRTTALPRAVQEVQTVVVGGETP